MVYEADWKDVREPGEWGLTDDGYVVELLHPVKAYQQTYGNPIRFRNFYAFSCARVWGPHGKLLWEPRRGQANYTDMKVGSWVDRECRRLRLKNAVKAYAIMALLVGHVDWTALGLIYRHDQKIPAASVKRIFRHPEVKQMIHEEFVKLMTSKGLTPEWVIDKLQATVKTAELKQDARAMLQAVMEVAGILGIKKEALQGGPARPYSRSDYDPVAAHMEEEFQLAEREVPRLPAPVEDEAL